MSKTEANVNAIVSVTLIFLVSATETIGDTSVLAVSGLGRDATTKETSGSIACDGLSAHYRRYLAVCRSLHLARMSAWLP